MVIRKPTLKQVINFLTDLQPMIPPKAFNCGQRVGDKNAYFFNKLNLTRTQFQDKDMEFKNELSKFAEQVAGNRFFRNKTVFKFVRGILDNLTSKGFLAGGKDTIGSSLVEVAFKEALRTGDELFTDLENLMGLGFSSAPLFSRMCKYNKNMVSKVNEMMDDLAYAPIERVFTSQKVSVKAVFCLFDMMKNGLKHKSYLDTRRMPYDIRNFSYILTLARKVFICETLGQVPKNQTEMIKSKILAYFQSMDHYKSEMNLF